MDTLLANLVNSLGNRGVYESGEQPLAMTIGLTLAAAVAVWFFPRGLITRRDDELRYSLLERLISVFVSTPVGYLQNRV